MTIGTTQRSAAVAALVLAVGVVVGLVACAAPEAPSGSGSGTTSTTVRPSSTTTVAGGGGGSSTTVAPGGSTTTVPGGSTTSVPGGPTTTSAPGTSVPVTTTTTTTTAPTTTTTWPTADVTVSPAAAVVATNPGYGFVKVYWNNQKPNQLVYVDICARPSSSPGFSTGLDCAPLSELNVNGSANGKGVADLLVFRGPETSGDLNWGCFAPGDTAPAGILKLTTCYVRVTSGQLSNSADAREAAFTIR